MSKRTLAGFVLALAFALAGCERAMHDMYDQPKYKPGARSALFADGRAARTPPPGTVPQSGGAAADTSSGRNGPRIAEPSIATPMPLGADGRALASGAPDEAVRENPLALTRPLLERGRERYDIYCAPCHGAAGDGDGRVVERGFPAPPSYHEERLRRASDGHLFDVISAGYGVMYPYADRIAVDDRWAIVDYIRALQLSRDAPRELLDPQDLARLHAEQGGRP